MSEERECRHGCLRRQCETCDAEQRAEQAEAERDNLRETRQIEIRATEQWREKAHEARQEAANLRQAAQEVLDAVWRGENSRFTEACTQLREALQSAPPASEPAKKERGDYSVAEVEAMVPMYPVPADRPYGDIPDEDIDLLYDNKWSLYDSDESADRPECSVCNDAPTTPFCSSCGQRPTQSDRPEPPLREGAMRAAEGCDSPHPDGDRPEPSEALDEAMNAVMYAAWSGKAMPADKVNHYAHIIRRHLTQPAPAVPDIREVLLGVYDGSIYIKDAEAQIRALAAQPSESPAVPDGVPALLHVNDAETALQRAMTAGFERPPTTDDKTILQRLAARGIYLATAPTPTDDGDSHD